jgi:hypothetical protein
MAGAAAPRGRNAAEADEVRGAARAVSRRAELDVAPALEGACQVRDLALHALWEGAADPDDERAAPGIGAEREVQLLLGERPVSSRTPYREFSASVM